MSAKFCRGCGTALKPNAKFCSACGTPVFRQEPAQVKPAQEPKEPVHRLNIQAPAASVQKAVLPTGSLTNAPMTGGEFAIDIADPVGEVSKALGKRFGLKNIIAGLAASGASFAAIWSVDSPVRLSVIISALAIVLRITLSLIRRRRK